MTTSNNALKSLASLVCTGEAVPLAYSLENAYEIHLTPEHPNPGNWNIHILLSLSCNNKSAFYFESVGN